MTVIFGANLQDCVYLAADMRLTTSLPLGVMYEDNFLKCHTFSQNMHCVAAGSANLASYLIKKIEESALKNENYSTFRDNIEEYFKIEVGLYPFVSNLPKVAFIFGGIDTTLRKSINMTKLVEYTKIMQQQGSPVNNRISNSYIDDMRRRAITGETGDSLTASDIPFSGIFSIQIEVTSQGINITKDEVGWGEYLLYGEGGLKKENVPPEYFIKLDLAGYGKPVTRKDIIYNNSLIIVSLFIKELIPKYNLRTVGGSIFAMEVNQFGGIFPTGDVMENSANGLVTLSSVFVNKDLQICTKTNGKLDPVRRLINYSQFSANDHATI